MKEQNKEDWMNKKWRPAMGWTYMVVCIFDFILFPIMFTVVQFWESEAVNDAFRQWEPITLTGAGLFHMAMGAVLGITAWSRGQEKIAGVTVPSSNMPVSHTPGLQTNNNMHQVVHRSSSPELYPPISAPGAVLAGYKGKKAPIEPEYPEI